MTVHTADGYRIGFEFDYDDDDEPERYFRALWPANHEDAALIGVYDEREWTIVTLPFSLLNDLYRAMQFDNNSYARRMIVRGRNAADRRDKARRTIIESLSTAELEDELTRRRAAVSDGSG